MLSRLNMRQGTSYAITTILNYAIIAIGAMTVFGALGVSRDKLQWLAAALSVGLGFGLQEIFGNFVSGLIILFERPVRIGDTVTIGTFSGTVSKIRIRATTITDFDRKEVIIPNKAFVTERLINWSLSDTVTRVVIRLGVAYGSDTDKVKEVLLKAAHDHPKVMQEPAPAVFFTTFGASTWIMNCVCMFENCAIAATRWMNSTAPSTACAGRMTSTLPLTSWKFICAMKKAMKSPK